MTVAANSISVQPWNRQLALGPRDLARTERSGMVVVHSDSGGGEGLFLVLKQLAVGRLDEDLFLIAATRRVRYIDDPERNQGRQGDKERGSNWRKLGNRVLGEGVRHRVEIRRWLTFI